MRRGRHLGVYFPGGAFDIPVTASAAFGGSSDSAGIDGYVGRATGYSYVWSMRFAFVPERRCKRLTATLSYDKCYGVMGSFLAAVGESSSSALPASGTAFSFNTSARTATVTLTGSFERGKTYYLRVFRAGSGDYYYVTGLKRSAVALKGE